MSIKDTLQLISLVVLLVLVVVNLLIYFDIRESVNLMKESHQLEYQLAMEQQTTLQELSKAQEENHIREYELALQQSAAISRLADAATAMALNEFLDTQSANSVTEPVTTDTGLQYEVLASGDGESPSAGDTAVVHYTGWLTDGTKFDSSVDRDQPFEFGVGQGNVIQGWDEGVALMKVGDKWKFTIPSELAYGERSIGNGLIPPNSTLVFEVELLDVK